jgi:hypothetical protein
MCDLCWDKVVAAVGSDKEGESGPKRSHHSQACYKTTPDGPQI